MNIAMNLDLEVRIWGPRPWEMQALTCELMTAMIRPKKVRAMNLDSIVLYLGTQNVVEVCAREVRIC